ncbi:MAG: L,D-transpeptidase [Chitinispirillia bacterium]|nr:L,D-transpeptidase [Chitinispirillia bacterium]
MWTSLNKFLSYKLKEIEFRLHTWKRSREISQAYGSRSDKKTGRPVGLSLIKGAKFGAAVVFALIIATGVTWGTIKAIPWFSELSASAKSTTDTTAAEQYANQIEAIDAPDIGELEAVVPPEGYLAQQSGSSGEPQTEVNEAAPLPPPANQTPLVDIFKAGAPHGIANRFLLADKAAKVLYVFKSAQGRGWEVERAFPMATGERHGPKRVEGDKKTPEGTYFIIGRKGRTELSVSPLYGPVAFVLNYPNEEDRRERRTGHGIWIHGSERGNLPPMHTAGCLALSNPDILELAGILGSGVATPVIIVSGTEGRAHLTDVNFANLRSERESIEKTFSNGQALFETIVTNWKNAWSSKDISAYSQFYSVNTFRSGAQRWDAFRDHKQRTFEMYSTINVDVNNIVLAELTENSATVKFMQTYSTNLNRLENAKRLFFTKVQGEWKITRESTFPKEELFL